MHIGNKIKALVVENSKISLVDFATKIGYTEPGMYNIFKSEDVNTRVIKLICKTLNINFSDVFIEKKESEYKKSTHLSMVHEEAEVYGEINYKQKYFDTLEKLNCANERLLSFTDIKKGSIKLKK